MPSVAERRRNNVRAGVFVTITLILALVVVMALTDAVNALLVRTNEYRVFFDVENGIKTLGAGSDVRVGGMSMGKVILVEPIFDQAEGGVLIGHDVVCEIDERLTLFADATVYVNSALIGAEAWLSIPNVGTRAVGPPSDNRLTGAVPEGMLSELLGPGRVDDADEIVENVKAFSSQLNEIGADWDRRVVPVLDEAKGITSDLRAVSSDLRETRWPAWAARVDEVMTWANSTTGRIDGSLEEAEAMFTDGRAVIAENRDDVRTTLTNAKDISEHIKGDTLAKVDALLANGDAAVTDARSALQTLRQDYDQWAVSIGDMVANLNLAGQQLKLASIEIRRSPWKVLYRPSSTELEHENLYEATRSFAMAAADLKAASAYVDRLLENHGDQLAGDRESFEQMRAHLERSVERYSVAQQALFDVLLTGPQ